MFFTFWSSLKSNLENSHKATSYRFNGKEFDQETGNYYYGARYYDPRLSIWLSVDPLAHYYPSHTPYNFVLNNPVRFTDPDGRSATCETCPDEERFEQYRNDPLVDYTYVPNEEGDGGEIHVSNHQQAGEVTVTAEEYGTTPADNTSASLNQIDPNASGSVFSANAQEYGEQIWAEATRDAFQMPDAKRQGDPIETFKLYDFWGDVYNEAVKEILGWFGVNDGNSPRPTPPGTPPVAPVPEEQKPTSVWVNKQRSNGSWRMVDSNMTKEDARNLRKLNPGVDVISISK